MIGEIHFKDFELTKEQGLKKPRPGRPYLGDIYLLKEYPEGTPLSEVSEFEVWNGERWVSPNSDH